MVNYLGGVDGNENPCSYKNLKRNFNTVQYNTKNIALQAIC